MVLWTLDNLRYTYHRRAANFFLEFLKFQQDWHLLQMIGKTCGNLVSIEPHLCTAFSHEDELKWFSEVTDAFTPLGRVILSDPLDYVEVSSCCLYRGANRVFRPGQVNRIIIPFGNIDRQQHSAFDSLWDWLKLSVVFCFLQHTFGCFWKIYRFLTCHSILK